MISKRKRKCVFYVKLNKTYFVTQGDEGIRITEIDIKTGKVLSPERLVWGGIGGRFPEAPHVYKKDGYYYLLLGEGGTEYAHSATIGRSKYLFGPYESCPLNPILTHCNRIGQGNPIQGVGHADFIQPTESQARLKSFTTGSNIGNYRFPGKHI